VSKVTSKLQVTVPKEIADQYGIRPGSQLAWLPAGDSLRVVPDGAAEEPVDVDERLRLFDAATSRQKRRQAGRRRAVSATRGWKREDLYGRGLAR
jgi:AbrB family looped-hinge helix DNA binding protein